MFDTLSIIIEFALEKPTSEEGLLYFRINKETNILVAELGSSTLLILELTIGH
jgi:hypothetical protein